MKRPDMRAGTLATRTSRPSRLAADSVRPTPAASGIEKTAHGTVCQRMTSPRFFAVGSRMFAEAISAMR